MITRLYIWVTSDCNLHCPYCIQEPVMAKHRGYQMPLSEVKKIVNSCKERGLHFDIIELTGGEGSLWKHLEEGVELFSEICDEVTLATNGNNPDRIIALGLKSWIVSESQATKEQMSFYNPLRHKLTVNKHKHKKMPDVAMPNSLPSICCTSVHPITHEPQTCFVYVKGRVFICPDAYSHVIRLGLDENDYSVDFKEDFWNTFYHKTYDKEICKYCLGNQKVWRQI